MEPSFTAVKYGVGLDVGKLTFYACVSAIDQIQRVKIKAVHSFANSAKGIADFIRWATHHSKGNSLPVHYLMEATGIYYEQLALALHSRQAYVSVILPQKANYYIKALGIKTKTDGVDAQGLATMACQQRLDAWKPISEAMYKLRQLTRQHTQLQEMKTQLHNQLLALEAGMYQSSEVKKQLAKMIEQIDRQLAECIKLIEKAIAENPDWKRKVKQICQIKGVGVLTIANLITETNEFLLFENQRQLVSYSGYDVVENQSGKRVGKTHISKRGNGRIRRALHMSALQVVRYQQKPFEKLFERVFERTRIKMKGYVAVQRKLLTIIYSLWKTDQAYDPNYRSEEETKVAPTEGATLHQPMMAVLGT
jgi:transposase